ncbi:hypothetical protein MIR68_007097 [Amoeboaphelidium protococcarum]|nr:hypothetical protein MIR68_007097 [Amoeboaphelidium protococcarum]
MTKTSSTVRLACVQTIDNAHEDTAWSLSWSRDGQYLLSSSSDKAINLYRFHGIDDTDDSQQQVIVQQPLTQIDRLQNGHKRTVRAVEFSPSGNTLVSASFDSSVGVWIKKDSGADYQDNNYDTSKFSFEYEASLEGHENEVKSIDFCPVAPLLATCSRDKSVWIWEYRVDEDDDDHSGRAIETDYECIAILQEHTGDVKRVKWHPSREILFSASYDDTIRVWKEDASGGDDWYCHQILTVHTGTVWSIDFNADGSRMVTCSADGSIILWSWDAGTDEWSVLQVLNDAHSQPVFDVAWKGDYVVSVGGDDAINLYKIAADQGNLELFSSIPNAHSSDINCVKWHPKDPIFSTCSDDGSIKLWKLQNK